MITSDGISIIGAHTDDLAYGLGSGMPWPRGALKQDMTRFKVITSDAPEGKKNLLVAGRETFLAMGSKALPNRYMAVLSTNFKGTQWLRKDDRIISVGDVDSLLAFCHENIPDLYHVFFIGGAKVWELGLQYASQAYITEVRRGVVDQDGLRRLSQPLADQAVSAGFTLTSKEVVDDIWDEPIYLRFLRYSKTK